MAGEADSVSSVSASACHIGGPIGVNPGELTLVYGSLWQQIGKTDFGLALRIIDFRYFTAGVIIYSDFHCYTKCQYCRIGVVNLKKFFHVKQF